MKKIIRITLFLFVVAGFSSCLKDKSIIGPDSPGAIRNVVEFLNPNRPASGPLVGQPVYVFSFDIVPSVDLVLPINFAGADEAPNDIKVTIALDQQALDSANRQGKDNMDMLQPNMYSVSSWEVTIPKGQRVANLVIQLKMDKFVKVSYGLGLRITNVVGTNAPISGNFGAIVTKINSKNKYDGIYSVKGASLNASNAALTGRFGPVERAFATTSATAVQWTGTVPWAGGASNLPAGYEPLIVIDPVTNKITISSKTAGMKQTDTYNHRYDPATKTIYFQFTYGAGPASRLFTDTATFVRKR